MQLAAPGDLEAVCGVGLLHTERDVGVQLAEQPVTNVAAGHEFTLLTCKRGVIHHKVHGNGGLTDLLERDWGDIVGRAERVSDVDVRDAGDGYDGADARLLYLHLVQTVKLIELADLHALLFLGIVRVAEHDLLIHGDLAVVYLADADASHIFIVINGTDQYLGSGIGIALRCGNIV